MPNPALAALLSGAKSALAQNDTQDQPNANNAMAVGDGESPIVDGRKSSPINKVPQQPVPYSAPDKPAPAPSSEPEAPVIPKTDAKDNNPLAASKPSPKRIAFPSGMILETPGHWTDGVVNTLSRELHSAATTVLGLPGALYHAAADPESPEESQKYGKGFEKKIGPTGRLIDRSLVQPLLNAVEDYKHGKVTIDDVLQNLPEALGGASGAVLAGKAASDIGKVGVKALDNTLTPAKSPAAKSSAPLATTDTETAADESQDFGPSQKVGAQSDYRKPMPRGLTGSDRLQWLNENIDPHVKIDIARHELAHYDYAAKSGHPTEDMFLTIGHDDTPNGGFSQGQVGTSNTFWRNLMKNAKTPEAKNAATTKYLKQLYAPEIVEEKQGTPPEKISQVTANDQLQAEKFMKKMGLDPDEMQSTRNDILGQLRKEITPKVMKRYTHAAKQVVTNHYGTYVSPWAVDHYLDGGVHEQIAGKLAAEDEEFNNSAGPPQLPEFDSIFGRK